MTPEAEAAIRERDAHWSPITDREGNNWTRDEPMTGENGRFDEFAAAIADRRALLAELDAARAENARLRTALEDVAVWLEAEADHPRSDPHPAMKLQASIARAALKGT